MESKIFGSLCRFRQRVSWQTAPRHSSPLPQAGSSSLALPGGFEPIVFRRLWPLHYTNFGAPLPLVTLWDARTTGFLAFQTSASSFPIARIEGQLQVPD